MTFENVIEPSDFRHYRAEILRKATGWRRFVMALGILAILLLLPWVGNFDFFTVMVTEILTMYLFFGFQFVVGRRVVPRADGITFETKTVKVDSTGVRQSSKRTDIFYAWDAFQSAQVTDKMLILYLEPALAIPIPRRNLHPESFHELIKMARQFAPQLEEDLADS